jgi:adenylosuccinate synthase
VRVAVGYERDGLAVRGFPAGARELERCVPVWRTFPGWRQPTTGVRRWAELPREARDYLEWVEREAGVPIRAVSVGAARDAEVARS